MYCSKCGAEIANGVNFCTNCGEKVEVFSNVIIHKESALICEKCGKVADGEMKYCNYCGGEIIATEKPSNNENNSSSVSGIATTLNSAAKNFIGLISLALLIILAIIYFITAIKGFSGNRDAFEWIEDGYKFLGYFLHWGICAIFAINTIQCIFKVALSGIKGKNINQAAISLLIVTFVNWICSIIWNEVEFESISIVLYRVFGIYSQITSTSFVILILVLICGLLCYRAEQE